VFSFNGRFKLATQIHASVMPAFEKSYEFNREFRRDQRANLSRRKMQLLQQAPKSPLHKLQFDDDLRGENFRHENGCVKLLDNTC
jgi:hypothetical protein